MGFDDEREWARGEVSSLACYDSPGSIELYPFEIFFPYLVASHSIICPPSFYSCVFYRHGPPGTGKTLVAKALCRDANLHFIYVPIADILCGEVCCTYDDS